MKKLIVIAAALLLASPAVASVYLGNSDYTQPFTTDTYTRALWHFDEQTGTDTPVLDVSGNNVHGTLATGFTNSYSASPMELDPNQTWVSSMAGFDTCAKAYWNGNSDSNSGSILVPRFDNTLYINTDATFEWWMNPDNSGPSSSGVILKYYTGGPYSITYKSGNIRFTWNRSGWHTLTDTTTISINDWTHVAITIDRMDVVDTEGTWINFWINGQLSSSHNTNWLGSWANANVGMFNGNYSPLYQQNQYTGMLDEIRVSDVIRYIPVNTKPVLKIKKSTTNPADAWLIPILDPSYAFRIYYNPSRK